MHANVNNICSIIQKILVKTPKNLLPHIPFDSFQALHIMKQAKSFNSRSHEYKNRVATIINSRVIVSSFSFPANDNWKTLQKIQEKILKSRKEFVDYSKKCKNTLKALTNIKKTLDFDYTENLSFFNLNSKGESQNTKKKDKKIIVFYRASKNFPSNRSPR